jgi:hypothetical protein
MLGLWPPNYQKVLKKPILSKYAYNTTVTCHFSIKKRKKKIFIFLEKEKKMIDTRLGEGGGLLSSFFLVFLIFNKKKITCGRGIWQGYYRHILTKWTLLNFFLVVWRAKVQVLAIRWTTCKTSNSLGG